MVTISNTTQMPISGRLSLSWNEGIRAVSDISNGGVYDGANTLTWPEVTIPGGQSIMEEVRLQTFSYMLGRELTFTITWDEGDGVIVTKTISYPVVAPAW